MFNTISLKGPGQSVPVAPRSLYNEASRFGLQSNMHMPSLVVFFTHHSRADAMIPQTHASHAIILSPYLLPKSLACKFLVMLGSFTTNPSNSLLMQT